ncbi:Crp/Fnr family transcriptional regulator [Enterocloster bolteae]|uniref:Crp/Fnr family transcriptional regulator n=1 Tax=Enterocloster bolteae TaxID=208479 RepID=UPI002A82DD65|nr:Crp/Fnr family transcriptional regulator [Enterocloster bolteae]
MDIHLLAGTRLFQGIREHEIEAMLTCLSAEERTYGKDAYIYRAGDVTGRVGVVLEGAVKIIKDDVWGNRKIIENIGGGQIFGETYACLKGEPLMVDVQASERSRILFMDVNRILTTCSSSCDFHNRLIRSLMYVLAGKNLMLTKKMDIITPKSLRERVMVYLSQESVKQGCRTVTVPFNRQQMADYLSVDRSALSAELSRMQRDGVISYEKNRFTIQ